jgi:hypothetical protein
MFGIGATKGAMASDARAADDAHNTLAQRTSMAARTGKGMATLEIIEIGSRYYAMRLKSGRFDWVL